MRVGLFWLFLMGVASPAPAGPIDISDFWRHVDVEAFDGRSDMRGTLFEPLTLHGNTYTTSSGLIRLFPPTENSVSQVCLSGPLEGHAPNPGTCIGTGGEDLEVLEVVLGAPSIRAGIWVGLTKRLREPLFWSSADVHFFDEADILPGSVFVSGPGFGFAGWEVDKRDHRRRIARMEIEDVASKNRVVVIDNLMWEPLPRRVHGGRPE